MSPRRVRIPIMSTAGSDTASKGNPTEAKPVRGRTPSRLTPNIRLNCMNRKLEYTILDVFAERPLEGNPLAVFHDGRGLSDAQMQAIARETNLSETTFVLPSGNPDHDRTEGMRVRIFTTQEELPFAGHPTLGTASWLHLNHPPLVGSRELKLLLSVGAITVRLEPRP